MMLRYVFPAMAMLLAIRCLAPRRANGWLNNPDSGAVIGALTLGLNAELLF